MADQQVAISRIPRGDAAQLSRSARQVVPPFLQKLYEIVNDPNNDELIRWSENGDSFFVLNHERFAREVLGHWFKHQKFTSFVRQLNMYGFHKIPQLQQGVLRNESDSEPWHFEHPHFRRGQPDLLCLIQRKKQPNQGADDAHMDIQEPVAAATAPPLSNLTAGQVLDIHSVVNGISAIKRHQQAISADLNELKTSNQLLWQEALMAREKHKKHQDTIDRILKFLAGVFGNTAEAVQKHDNSSESPPTAMIPRKRPRLMITGSDDDQNAKFASVEELSDHRSDASRLSPDRSLRVESPEPSAVSPSVAPSEAFSPAPTEISTSYFGHGQPLRPSEIISRSSTVEPSRPGATPVTPAVDNPSHNGFAPTPSSLSSSLTTTNHMQGASPEMWSAVQQLLSSPNGMQRFMQALATQNNFPMPPPNDPTIPPPSIKPNPDTSTQLTHYDPNAYDLSRFRTDLPSSLGATGAHTNNALQQANLPFLMQATRSDESEGPGLDALMENADRLQKSYRDATEINADVDALQHSLNSLIETMGLDPNGLAGSSAADGVVPGITMTNGLTNSSTSAMPGIPGAGGGGGSTDPTSADFDFEAFLNDLSQNTPAGISPFDPNAPMTDASIDTGFLDQPRDIPPSAVSPLLDPAIIQPPITNLTPNVPSSSSRKRKSVVADVPPAIDVPEISPKTKRKR